MTRSRRNSSAVVPLFPVQQQGSLEIARDNISSLQPALKKKARLDRIYKFDFIGNIARSLGYGARDSGEDAESGKIDYKKRRGIIGAAASATAATVALSLLATGAVKGVEAISEQLSQRDPITDPSELFPKANIKSQDEVYRIDQTTFYEKAGNVVCHFNGIDSPQRVLIARNEGFSNGAVAVKGEGFRLDVGTDCYDSALFLVTEMNPKGGIFINAPETATATPWDDWSAQHPTAQQPR